MWTDIFISKTYLFIIYKFNNSQIHNLFGTCTYLKVNIDFRMKLINEFQILRLLIFNNVSMTNIVFISCNKNLFKNSSFISDTKL